MRILHTEASLGWGGQEIRIATESQAFIQHGHDVAIAADINSQLALKAKEYGVPLYAIHLNKKKLSNLNELKKIIKDFQPDVLSCHSSTDHWLSAIAKLTSTDKPAIVRTRHISARVNRNWPTKWLYRIASEAIMTTGEIIKADLLEDNFVRPEQIFSVPTGIDLTKFTPGKISAIRESLKIPDNHFVFGIVAALRSWKGHEYLIEAFHQLTDSNVSLIIVGDGGQKSTYLEKASNGLQAKNIHFVGHQNDVIPYLKSLDCFVLPSYANEGIPQAILQAMAMGLPIITCAVGGIPEAADGYESVIFATPQNSASLTKAMLQQKNSEPREISPQTKYSIEKMYESALHVYNLAIKKNHAHH